MDYLSQLYEWISSKDDSYQARYSFEEFSDKMQDPAYAAEMHEWISGIDKSFASRRPLDDFIETVKKKDDTKLSLSTSEGMQSALGSKDGSSDSSVKKTTLDPQKEIDFQEWWNTNPDVLAWKDAYTKRTGNPPDVESNEEDYRLAFQKGVVPQ